MELILPNGPIPLDPGVLRAATTIWSVGGVDDSRPADERAAFEARMRSAWPGVVRLVERLLAWPGGTAEVEDVAQETFLAAWRARHEFRGEAEWTTWVHTIAVRRAHDVGRTRERRRRWFGRLWSGTEVDALESESTSPADRVEDAVSGEVRAALRRMRQNDREVLVLRYLEGLGVDEIAARLEIAGDAVNTRLSRARTRMRPLLEKLERESVR